MLIAPFPIPFRSNNSSTLQRKREKSLPSFNTDAYATSKKRCVVKLQVKMLVIGITLGEEDILGVIFAVQYCFARKISI